MLLRVRSKDGTVRITVDGTDTFKDIADKTAAAFNVTDTTNMAFGKGPSPQEAAPLPQLAQQTVNSAGLKHGDMIHLVFLETPHLHTPGEHVDEPQAAVTNAGPVQEYVDIDTLKTIQQDPVDDLLEKQDGLIPRSKDSNFCRHGANAMCDYCMPLEPYDQKYLEQNKIKHMSFHAYLRQLNAAQQSKASSSTITKQLPPLEEQNYKVRVPCSGGHAPWPEGICTKCQPSAITLQSQPFRLVDHIEFSSASLIDNFIHYWRATGCQRLGYLYGRYEPYTEVPLGIKAVVEAIYEPPQEDHMDGLALSLPWQEENAINEVAGACGLQPVGMIFTDLLDDGTGKGTVVTKRHVDSFFLSSLECSFAAEMQRLHPNRSRYSPTGKFGSKFVTCIISGDEQGGIGVSGYQVSNTMVAMQEAGIVEPSMKPSVMLVKEGIPHQRYVPEVFYKYKNKYGVAVQEPAKPTFPVEYLLVNVTNGFPQNPNPAFASVVPFPIENRTGLETQNLGKLSQRLSSCNSSAEYLTALSDFHLLCFIRSSGFLSTEEFTALCKAILQHDVDTFTSIQQSNGWKTLETVLRESGHQDGSAEMSRTTSATSGVATPGTSGSVEVTCRFCTFVNPARSSSCEMCGLPLD
ncbi:NPL4 family-domain-containing protein [Umbelopsis sp. AD052]|nr:NPL4 family-domain-containing protein [Umbelopsis sp. AD052]